MGPADEARKRLTRYFTIQCEDYHDPVQYRSLERAKQVVWLIRTRSMHNAGCPYDHWVNEWAYRDGRDVIITKHIVDQVEPDRSPPTS